MRLWLRLFLAFAALSGAALFGFVAWQQGNFRQSFLEYLDEVAGQRLEAAVARLGAAWTEHGSWDFLRADPEQFGELVEPGRPHRAFDAGDSGAPPVPGRPPPHEPPPEPGTEPMPPLPGEPVGPHGPPHRRGPPDLMPRLQLVDAAGAIVVGARETGADPLDLPILADGRRVGSLRLQRQSRISTAIDVAFSRSQLRDAVLAGAIILLGALLFAFALARWLLAPVRALARGTRALAAGDYGERVATSRGDELGELARDFNRLAATLEQHRQARQRWGADIAHELRTPLSILRGEIQALQDGVRAPTPGALESLQAECQRLGSLIDDLYQLALADAGALDYRFEQLDAADLVREAVDAQRGALAGAGIAVEEAIAASAPLRGDPRRLTQLVDNLLANARRYTDAPGRIRIELEPIGAGIVLRVDDSPPGVPAEALPRLFERLYRVDASRARLSGGAGLGLSICQAIVDAHGGSIAARHSPLGGVRIEVTLPRDGTGAP